MAAKRAIKRVKRATERIQVPVLPDEREELKDRASKAGLTVAGLLRKGVGLKPLSRGGPQEGSGRPPKKRAAKKAK